MKKLGKARLAGWVLSGILAAFLIGGSAMGKFREWEGKDEMFGKLGYTDDVMKAIGVVEVFVTLLFVIPQSGFVGAILLTGYLGGATATHVRVGDSWEAPVIMGVVVWIAFGLRRPEVFALALGKAPIRKE